MPIWAIQLVKLSSRFSCLSSSSLFLYVSTAISNIDEFPLSRLVETIHLTLTALHAKTYIGSLLAHLPGRLYFFPCS